MQQKTKKCLYKDFVLWWHSNLNFISFFPAKLLKAWKCPINPISLNYLNKFLDKICACICVGFLQLSAIVLTYFPESMDECGIKFLLAMRFHSYLARTLPPHQRRQLQKEGLRSHYIVWAFHSEATEVVNASSYSLSLLELYTSSSLVFSAQDLLVSFQVFLSFLCKSTWVSCSSHLKLPGLSSWAFLPKFSWVISATPLKFPSSFVLRLLLGSSCVSSFIAPNYSAFKKVWIKLFCFIRI